MYKYTCKCAGVEAGQWQMSLVSGWPLRASRITCLCRCCSHTYATEPGLYMVLEIRTQVLTLAQQTLSTDQATSLAQAVLTRDINIAVMLIRAYIIAFNMFLWKRGPGTKVLRTFENHNAACQGQVKGKRTLALASPPDPVFFLCVLRLFL